MNKVTMKISQRYEGFGSGGDAAAVTAAMRDAATRAADAVDADLNIVLVYGEPHVLAVTGGSDEQNAAIHNAAYTAGEAAYADR